MDVHLSKFDLLTVASVEKPIVAECCFGLSYAQVRLDGPISWLDAVNHVLTMPVDDDVLEAWIIERGKDPIALYKLAVSSSFLRLTDNVITDSKTLTEMHDQYEHALHVRQEIADKKPSLNDDKPVNSQHGHSETSNQ